MKFNLQAVENKLKTFEREFAGKQVVVGVPKGKNYPDGTPVARVAATHEWGDPAHKIPARPIFRPTLDRESKAWVSTMAKLLRQVGKGNITGFDVLDAIGITMAADIKKTLADLQSPKLSPITVMLRKWRKEYDPRAASPNAVQLAAVALRSGEDPGSDNKPLNDTGYLLASIRHTVIG